MKKPILVVLAAGMGSRYGGLKQMDPVGPGGEFIIDYSIYDAHRGGFDTVVFIIKHEIEDAFRETVGRRVSRHMEVRYAFQQLDDLPEGYAVPEGRVKPFGTAHAIYAARNVVDAPFAVINADDYYGPEAFRAAYQFLSATADEPGRYHYAMVGYHLANTVTEHGSVARGICVTNGGMLQSVTEHTCIEVRDGAIRSALDGGERWLTLAPDTLVSMNLWCFQPSFLAETAAGFPAFLDETLAKNPLKGEYFLPAVVTRLLEEGKADVKMLESRDKWYGVTYQADRPAVVQALADKTAEGLYPSPLWPEARG
ncbi:MAG: NTP transferase domain-containing protein [Clostridiales bacterium]|nr:NTP transferase domain-containing protein [Clostridiales bacterium]